MIARKFLAAGAALAMLSTSVVQAQEVPPNDLLLATLWTQRSVEYKANALTVFALAQIRLDQALADKSWTAAPGEQKGDFANLPPAVILDVDETLVDNSLYQVWMLKNNQTFSTKTWNEFCAAQVSRAIPGAVEFTKYADSKGVKVFYITNRDAATEKDTRENMAEARLPDGRQRRHLPDAERAEGVGQRQGHAPRRRDQGLSRAAEHRRQFRRLRRPLSHAARPTA